MVLAPAISSTRVTWPLTANQQPLLLPPNLWQPIRDQYSFITPSGNAANAISDIRAVAKLTNDNTAAYLRLAQLHYVMGEEDESLK